MKDRRAAPPDLVAASLGIISAGQESSGAFLAGPTFSQYGYSWFRDGAFIAEALDLVGRTEWSARFHHWVAGVVVASAAGLERARAAARAGHLPDTVDYLHCRYDADGRPADAEWPAFQLDGPGIWLWSVAHHLRSGGRLDAEMHAAIEAIVRYLGDLWPLPCADAWEEYPEHVHTSTLAAIRAGVQAALTLVPSLAAEPAIARLRAEIDGRMSVVDGAYTKWSGNGEVDASLLWMAAPYKSVLATEPRFAATLRRIEDEIISEGPGVHRYRSDTYYGGGAWPVLSSAYGRVLLRRDDPGDLDRAVAALRWIETQADEHGALPEQVAEHALAPERIEEWRERWGESARPLLWSHAAYLSLWAELSARTDVVGPSA